MTTNPNIYGNKTKFVFNKRVKLNKTDETLLRLREDIQKINDMNLEISSEIVSENEIFQTYGTYSNFYIMNMRLLLICHFIISFDEEERKQKINEYKSDIFKIFGASSIEEKTKIMEDVLIYIYYILYNQQEEEESDDEEYENEEYENEENEENDVNDFAQDILRDINEVWDNSKFIKPNKIITLDEDNRIYFTIKNKSNIISIMTNEEKNKVSIYLIPKKYLNEKDENTYIIKDSSKLSLINCNGNPIDDYDKFVKEKIMPIYFNN